MIEEVIYYTELFDLYKNLFSERQISTFKDYFFENLTIEEIALNNNVSKNAVSKMIKGIKESLEEYESKLHMYRFLTNLEKEFSNDDKTLQRIERCKVKS